MLRLTAVGYFEISAAGCLRLMAYGHLEIESLRLFEIKPNLSISAQPISLRSN